MRLPVIARRTVRMHECHIKKSFFPIVWCVWVSDKYARIIANPPRDTTHTHRPAQPDCQRSNQILLLFNVFFSLPPRIVSYGKCDTVSTIFIRLWMGFWSVLRVLN